MYCPTCGNLRNTDGNFCERCGVHFRISVESAQPTSSQSTKSSSSAGSSTSVKIPVKFNKFMLNKCREEEFTSIQKRKRDDRFVKTKRGKKEETVKVFYNCT